MRLVQEPAAPYVSDKYNKNGGSVLTRPALFRTNGPIFGSNCRPGHDERGTGTALQSVVHACRPDEWGTGGTVLQSAVHACRPDEWGTGTVLQSAVHVCRPQKASGGMGAWTTRPTRLVVHTQRPWTALQKGPAWTRIAKVALCQNHKEKIAINDFLRIFAVPTGISAAWNWRGG